MTKGFRSGQIVLLLAIAVAALLVLALLNVDTFIAVRAKMRVENAGDAAALAAARRQGSLINEIAVLNIDHIKYALQTNAAKCAEVVLAQRRKALLGPIDALRRADEAARKNGMAKREEFAQILKGHVDDIAEMYVPQSDEGDPYPEPYPGAWQEYMSEIQNVLSGGLHAGADNIEFYDAGCWGHLLLNPQFYNAIAGRNWCWFHFHAKSALENYTSYNDWAPLPKTDSKSKDNCEIFSLHLVAKKCALTDVFSADEIIALIERYLPGEAASMDEEGEGIPGTLLADPAQTWFFFDDDYWHEWFDGMRLVGEDIEDFPLLGEIKDLYNVRGAAAIVRCIASAPGVIEDSKSVFSWCAAAKPFGTLDPLDGPVATVTSVNYFVLPCMNDARLVPVDSAGGAYLATADIGWVKHIREHLPKYLEKGPYAIMGCGYCDRLREWESSVFRHQGLTWLKYNSKTCRRGSGSSGAHGGTRHGH